METTSPGASPGGGNPRSTKAQVDIHPPGPSALMQLSTGTNSCPAKSQTRLSESHSSSSQCSTCFRAPCSVPSRPQPSPFGPVHSIWTTGDPAPTSIPVFPLLIHISGGKLNQRKHNDSQRTHNDSQRTHNELSAFPAGGYCQHLCWGCHGKGNSATSTGTRRARGMRPGE